MTNPHHAVRSDQQPGPQLGPGEAAKELMPVEMQQVQGGSMPSRFPRKVGLVNTNYIYYGFYQPTDS